MKNDIGNINKKLEFISLFSRETQKVNPSKMELVGESPDKRESKKEGWQELVIV